jgi:hypothetical protein
MKSDNKTDDFRKEFVFGSTKLVAIGGLKPHISGVCF